MADHTGESFRGLQYRLRASTPMPIAAGYFVLHTFGAELNELTIWECTTALPASSEFRGQGKESGLTSAQFSRIGDRSGQYYQGREVGPPIYIDEDELDFNF